ncbi:FAD:protein FMN transferase [Frankia sp. Cppng1_Ct_nod]|uniref:FAD:protein FMN transferase n=1 Tax=Frankia sp. Cppng1_Ct_nod TaxID=2897162 RepID=UPI002023EB32|nr:FAD:protein FMN transferase [Frankia sp. Cppng1_Ct_nod]
MSTVADAEWKAIGTTVRVVVTDPSRLSEARLMLAADIAALDVSCSRFRPDSELVAVNHADGRPVMVSPLLAEAVAVALHAAALTNGDLDPTVGGALAEIGYDRDFPLVPPTGPPAPMTVRHVPGWRQIVLDRTTGQLTVPARVRLDLGATAKAWAADRAAVRLAEAVGCGVLVSLGGDIAVAGQPPTGGWRIRVQDVTGHPDAPATGPSAAITISEGGLATSGTGARRWRRGGDMLHHILDPRSGLPAAPVWRTVSVAAATCLDANIAATTSIIRGWPALGWLARLDLHARLVEHTGTIHTVAGWPREPQEPQEAMSDETERDETKEIAAA